MENKTYRDNLYDLGIDLIHTGRSLCPKCSRDRSKKNDKCLQVTFDSDAVKYHCHHCGWSGVVSYENRSKNNFVPVKKTYVKPQPIKKEDKKQPLYDYFKSRGITQETVDTFQLELSAGNIIFPYYRNGELVNVKQRSIKEKKFLQAKDGMPSMFGMDTVPTSVKTICITEGEIDAMSLYQCGYYAVSVNQGGNDTNLDCITNCFEFMNSFDTIVIAGDNDDVGRILVNNLKERFKHKLIKVVDWSGYYDGIIKDANDCLKQPDGKFIIDDAINLAKEVGINGITTYSEHKQELLDWFRGKRDILFSTGWDNIDKVFQIQKGRLMVVTGISGKGKSLFIDNLLFNLSKLYDWKHLMANFETTFASHMATLSQMIVKKPCGINAFTRMSEEEFSKSIDYASEHFYRFDINKQWSISEILERAESSIIKYRYDTLVVDPYNRLAQEKFDREDKYVENILNALRTFAVNHKVFVIFIAHPTKIADTEQIPSMQNISGGTAWQSIADYGIVIHRFRDKTSGQLLTQSIVKIEKVKDDTLGNTAGGDMYLDYNYNSYSLIPATNIQKQ